MIVRARIPDRTVTPSPLHARAGLVACFAATLATTVTHAAPAASSVKLATALELPAAAEQMPAKPAPAKESPAKPTPTKETPAKPAPPKDAPGKAPPAQDADAEARAAAAAALDKAFGGGDEAARTSAIEAAAPRLDPALVAKVAKGLGDKSIAVRRAAIEALRYSKLAESGRALRTAARDEPVLRKDGEQHAALLRAVAQHGAPEALAILTDEMWASNDPRVLQARILGFGRVRTRASLQALVGILRTTSASKIEPYMEHVRTSLLVLTGADEGTSIEGWLRWWGESGANVTVLEKPAPLPKHLQVAWDAYWGESKPDARPTKRADRGRGDPEGAPTR